MVRALVCLALVTLLSAPIFHQSAEKKPVFEIADVHSSPPSSNILSQFVRGPYTGGGRYEVLSATILDLVRIAYSPADARVLDADKVVGGPDWLDFDRFDVIGKLPDHSSTENMKVMLQTLLADRFKLVIHDDTKPLPAMALTVGKKSLLKEADGTEETGCKLQSQSSAAGPGTLTINLNGTAIVLGPGSMVSYVCRNMTMAAFADGMRSMFFANINNNRVIDQTGLKGSWNFDIKFSLPIRAPGLEPGDTVTFTDAVQKQLGLELVPTKVPTPVLVVESANEKPTPNPPGLAEALPPLPEEFEVVDVKPTAPGARGGKYQVLPSGRVDLENQSLRSLIQRAWNISFLSSGDALVGPNFMDTARFNIIAKAPIFGAPPESFAERPGPPEAQQVDPESIDPMLRHLLIERFGLTFHMEERSLNAFTLTAVKPKLQKADPANRTGFHEGPGPDGKDPRIANPAVGRLVTCQNMTMAQFVANLPLIASGYILGASVVDATGLKGAWDFTLSFSAAGILNGGGGARGGDAAGGGGTPLAADPSGITLYEAMERQLGLKLQQTKRPASVMIIDHLEEKPKEP